MPNNRGRKAKENKKERGHKGGQGSQEKRENMPWEESDEDMGKMSGEENR